jgi:chemotaxis protein CheZ
MQIMTFSLNQGTDLGIRMTEIRKIESIKSLPSDISGRILCFPHQWFGYSSPDSASGLKGISLSSSRKALIIVPRIGRILRLADEPEKGSPHPDLPFLSRHRTMEGPDTWVIDIPELDKHLSATPQDDPPPTATIPQELTGGDSSGPDLFQQVGQTARDIQRVLSLSSSMVDSLRIMEGKLPETSHGLEVISQMTEEAAHKLMNTLENIMEEHARIRESLRTIARDPSTAGEKISRIEETLNQADEKVMAGFEAMAFQDLVGQNIKLVGSHLKELESRLVRILIETSPDSSEKPGNDEKSEGKGNGQESISLKGVKAQGDIDQNTVDQLLSEFGF